MFLCLLVGLQNDVPAYFNHSQRENNAKFFHALKPEKDRNNSSFVWLEPQVSWFNSLLAYFEVVGKAFSTKFGLHALLV